MKNFQLYVGGTNNITYRYEIEKVDDAFSVRIFNVVHTSHIDVGTKVLRFISAQDVMEECFSHYIKRSSSTSWLYGLFNK